MNYVGNISILDRGDAPAQAIIDRNARSLAQRVADETKQELAKVLHRVDNVSILVLLVFLVFLSRLGLIILLNTKVCFAYKTSPKISTKGMNYHFILRKYVYIIMSVCGVHRDLG